MSKLSYNYLSVNRAVEYPHLDRLKPRILFTMNAWGEAADFKRRYPNCCVIHRISEAEESDMHLTPGKTLAHLKRRAAEIQHSRVYINLGTEPDISDDSKLKKLNDEYLIALKWAVDNNVRVAAPHFAHYRLEGATWLIVEPLIDFIADSPVDPIDGLPLLIATFDEYHAYTPFSGVADSRWAGTNEEKHIAPEYWLKSNIPKYYHHGRKNDYMRDRKARGKAIPFFADTEIGADRLQDVEPWLNTLQGTAPKGRGWLTLTPQYEKDYGQNTPHKWSPPKAYAKGLVAMVNEIDSEFGAKFLGGCIFARGTNGDSQWLPFDVRNQPEFDAELESAQAGESTMTNPTPEPKPTDAGGAELARITQDYNWRTGPGKSYPIIRSVKAGEVLNHYPHETNKTVADGFTWVYVETLNDGVVTGGGFMALESQFVDLIPADWPKDTFTFLGVPFVSQRNTGMNNCGPAALTSILNYIGGVTYNPTLQNLTIQDVIAQVGNAGEFTSFQQLIDAAGHWGVMAFARTNQSLAMLRAELTALRPFIALVERGKLPGATQTHPFTGAHFVPVAGFDESYINIFDPLALTEETGGDMLIYPSEFRAAWRATTGNSALFQALVFDESAFIPKEPPPSTSGNFTAAELEALANLHRTAALHNEALALNLNAVAQIAGDIASTYNDIAAIYQAALDRLKG